ncbi:hypothetical protein D3C80_1979100 [compost metagenome]
MAAGLLARLLNMAPLAVIIWKIISITCWNASVIWDRASLSLSITPSSKVIA